jgi:predicted transposase/invertase (TIGR01784 family)
MGRYINLFTDFGFKKIFGTESNKNFLINFLNELLSGVEDPIVSLTYIKNEHLGAKALDRRSVFDLYCENQKGEKFIVEIQRTPQDYFKDRSIYYSTFATQEQSVLQREWNYELKGVYTIAILDFTFNDSEAQKDKVVSYVKLMNIDTQKVFYDKLTFVYLEMPKFTKTENELTSDFDKWLFVLNNIYKLDRLPKKVKNDTFEQLFKQAEIAKFSPKQQYSYQDSLKHYRDMKNSLDKAEREGRQEGIQDEKVETVKRGFEKGLSTELLAELTNMTVEEVFAIKTALGL